MTKSLSRMERWNDVEGNISLIRLTWIFASNLSTWVTKRGFCSTPIVLRRWLPLFSNLIGVFPLLTSNKLTERFYLQSSVSLPILISCLWGGRWWSEWPKRAFVLLCLTLNCFLAPPDAGKTFNECFANLI